MSIPANCQGFKPLHFFRAESYVSHPDSDLSTHCYCELSFSARLEQPRRTRMHVKVWLFHRPNLSGASPSSIGALHEGLEWGIRLSAHDNGEILDKLQAAFESYWEEDEFEFYRACTLPRRPVRAAPACYSWPTARKSCSRAVTFCQVLRDGSFGELMLDGKGLSHWRHVFASVQSLAELDRAALAPDTFAVVIVGESHAAAAASNKRCQSYLNPIRLLGFNACAKST